MSELLSSGFFCRQCGMWFDDSEGVDEVCERCANELVCPGGGIDDLCSGDPSSCGLCC